VLYVGIMEPNPVSFHRIFLVSKTLFSTEIRICHEISPRGSATLEFGGREMLLFNPNLIRRRVESGFWGRDRLGYSLSG
jgi:hypothetical protein